MLKQVVRPTHKLPPDSDSQDEHEGQKQQPNPLLSTSADQHSDHSQNQLEPTPDDLNGESNDNTTSIEDIYTNLASKSPTLQRLAQTQKPEPKDPQPALSDPDSPHQPASSGEPNPSPADPEIQHLQKLIQEASDKIQSIEEKKLEAQKAQQTEPKEEVEAFNGVSSSEEADTIIRERLNHLQKENLKLKNQLELIHNDFKKEKQDLDKTIKTLKTELHRSAPIQENKFFSFSKELREAVKAIENISDVSIPSRGTQVVLESQPPTTNMVETNSEPIKAQPKLITTSQTPPDQQPSTTTKDSQPPENPSLTPKSDDSPKPSGKEKKLLITGVALLVVLMLGGILSFQLTARAKVNEKLVEEYLQVQGAQSGELTQASKTNNGITPDKQLELPYEETQWEVVEEPAVGVRVRYPANLTERLHSSNGITFMRKDSYIFKFLGVPSDKTIEEYWEERKESGVKYEANQIDFKNKPTLHLTPLEELEYPIEKYITKHKDMIYEFWFAAPSQKYSEADFKRIEDMKQSVTFLH